MRAKALIPASKRELPIHPKMETAESSSNSSFIRAEEWKLLVFLELAYDQRECLVFSKPTHVNDLCHREANVFLINFYMARTKETCQKVDPKSHKVSGYMAVMHVELQDHYFGYPNMPIHGTSQFFEDTYGPNEKNSNTYPLQINGTKDNDQRGSSHCES